MHDAERGVAFLNGLDDHPDGLTWPFGALHADTPISRNAGEALLTYDHMPGATLYVDNHAFVAALCRKAPQLTTGAQRWRWAKPLIAAALVIVAAGAALWASGIRPAHTIATLLPDHTRTAFGEKVVAYMTRQHKRCIATDGQAALDQVFARLMPGSAERAKFKVVTVDWAIVNAFAAPGGQIVLTQGLINAATSSEEVAGVLAHEIGHGLELHPEAGIVRAFGLSAVMDIMLGGSGGTLGSISGMLIQNSYARDDERAADQQALRLLKQGQVSKQGLANFFKRIASGKIDGMRDSGGPSALDLLRTHPRPGERAAYIETGPDYASRPLLRPAEWKALKGICRLKAG